MNKRSNERVRTKIFITMNMEEVGKCIISEIEKGKIILKGKIIEKYD